MGKKSDKKTKSERINALRKQYDAFLEEDKKRKERNEFILGRLDNMRYSVTAVQTRHKPIVYGEAMPVHNRGAYRPEQFERHDLSADSDIQINRPSHHDMQLDIPRNCFNNKSLLKEISKKYILIPKLRSSLVNDYVGTIPPQSLPVAVSSPQSNITSNEDWKSKYDILEQLKNNEKEEQTDKYTNDELYPVKEKQTLSKDDAKNIVNNQKHYGGFKTQEGGDGYALQSYNTKEFTTKYEEVAEKNLTSDKVRVESEPQNIERPKINDNKDQEPTTDQAPNTSASAYTTPRTNIVYDDYKLENQSLENYAPVECVQANNIEQNVYDTNYPNENAVASEYIKEVTKNTEHEINDVPHQEEYPVQYEQPIEVEGKFPDSENVYLDPDDYSPIQVLDPSALVGKNHNEPVNETATDIKEDEVDEYPVEMLNVQEFTPKDDIKLIEGENVNPRYFATENKIEPLNGNNPQTETVGENAVEPQDSSGIEAFDAEQAEMFYSEETPEYAYEQQQENALNANQDNSNEPPAPAQDYANYESPATALQEEYPVEINEHEETNSRYDQNYEQQYAPEYEQQYVQNVGYDQTEQQQYVQPEVYDQTEQLQYVQPDVYDQAEQQQYVQPEGYNQTEQQQYVQPEGYDQTEQQQYTQPEGYDQTQQQYEDYEYQQPDHDTVQNIQQALDNEAGYGDQHNSEAIKAETKVEPAAQVVDQKIA